MKTLLTLIVVLAIAAGAYYYLSNGSGKQDLRRTEEQAAARANEMKDAVKDKMKDFSLSGPDIKQELECTGKVVRKKAEQVGNAIAAATADARITTTIKAKLVKDPNLSAF